MDGSTFVPAQAPDLSLVETVRPDGWREIVSADGRFKFAIYRALRSEPGPRLLILRFRPMDDAPCETQNLRVAWRLARQIDASEVSLVHIHASRPPAGGDAWVPTSEDAEMVEKVARAAIERAVVSGAGVYCAWGNTAWRLGRDLAAARWIADAGGQALAFGLTRAGNPMPHVFVTDARAAKPWSPKPRFGARAAE